jgi:hypothetical protein
MDIEIVETGNGGDALLKGADLSLISGFENFPYLALFGGNTEASTPQKRLESAQAFDYWGNAFLPTETLRFNSETEKALHDIPLTSSGRLLIEQAIKNDLLFMRPFAEVKVQTEIIATDNLKISIGIKKPDNLEEKQFIYIWDSTAGELAANESYTANPYVVPDEFLQYELQFPL